MKKILPETFQEYKYLSSPLISPDGNYTAFVMQTMDLENNRYLANLYLISNDGGEPRQLTVSNDVRKFCWTPQNTLLYSAPRGELFEKAKKEMRPLTALYELDPATGEETLFTTIPLFCGLPEFLEDGRLLVSAQVDLNRPDFEKMDEDQRQREAPLYENPPYQILDELPYWNDGRGFVGKKRNTLFLYRPGDTQAAPITPKYFQVMGMSHLKDLILYIGSEYKTCAEFRKGVYLYSLKTQTTRCLIQPGNFDIVQAVLINPQTAIVRMNAKEDSPYAEGTFYRLDLENGNFQKISDYENKSEFCCIVGDVMLGLGQPFKVHKEKLYFVTVENECGYIRSIDAQGNLSPRYTRDGVSNFFDVNEHGLVLYGYRGDHLGELYFLEKDGIERQLTHFNDFVVENYHISPRIPINYTGSDGFTIHGWVMPPVNYQPGRKYPGILNIHGGPRGTWGCEFNHEMQMWANAGYFVMFCNPRGSAGRGIRFADLDLGMGGADYVNFMEFTDECLRKWPDIDPDHLGVAGGSYGGYMVNWIIGHTDRFAAASSQRSISNWISMDGLSDMGYYANGLQFGGFVEDIPEHLWDISPLKYAHRAVTPTIFLQSEGDYRCPMEQALQMYALLCRRGVETRMILFKGESHGLSREGKPQNRLARMLEIKNWMDAHLKPIVPITEEEQKKGGS